MKQKQKGGGDSKVQVLVAPTTVVRGRGTVKELAVDVLAENVRSFMKQVGTMLEKTPDSISQFRFAEFTVSAEISANGKLTILGVGGEASAKGGITFTFKRT